MPKQGRVAIELPSPWYIPALVTTPEALTQVVADYLDQSYFVFDVETVGTREPRTGGAKGADKPPLDEMTNSVIWIALACPGRVDIIPLGHPGRPGQPAPPQLDRALALTCLRPLFFSPIRKIGHNCLFDVLSLSKYWGEIPPGPFGDTGSLIHLLNENLPAYDLGSLVEHFLGFTYAKLGKGAMDEFPFVNVAAYVGLDAKLTQLLWAIKRPILDRSGRGKLLKILQLECDITEVLIHAKRRGALVDRQAFITLDDYLTGELKKTSAEILSMVAEQLSHESWRPKKSDLPPPFPFLITSTQQKARLLYAPAAEGGLGLPCKVRTDKGANSTAEKALQPLVRKHPVVPLLLRHANLSKLKGTYSSGFAPHIQDDDRIRARLNQRGTATGRFSSNSPNAQNIPRQSEDESAARIRSMFVAPPGYVLVVGDFGQIEYRLMAHFAGPLVKNSKMLKAFLDNIDLHSMTASGLFEKPVEEVTKEERQRGKTINFLSLFGGGENTLIEKGLVKTPAAAKKLMEGFHATYPELRVFTESVIKRCREMPKPYVETLWGRRRRLPDINHPLFSHEAGRRRSYAERQAVNHIIQGSAADVNKAAMVRAFRRIERSGLKGQAFLILTVHDEIMLEVPEAHAALGVALLTEAMEGVKVNLRVPLVADVHSGPNWASCK